MYMYVFFFLFLSDLDISELPRVCVFVCVSNFYELND